MNYHLSKRDHQEHHAKLGLYHLAKQMHGGMPLDQAEHDLHKEALAAAADVEHLLLCPLGRKPHVFKPESPPDHITIVGAKVVLPGGQEVWPEKGENHHLPPLLAVCARHGAAEIARAFTHDWNRHDHRGKRIHAEPRSREAAKRSGSGSDRVTRRQKGKHHGG